MVNVDKISCLPVIYADMNVYRYLACGDIAIQRPDRFLWVYSSVHLDELSRSENRDALVGMKQLKAVEIVDELNSNFQSVGNIVIKDYVDPDERFNRHLESISDVEDFANPLEEIMLRLFGADNFDELQKSCLNSFDKIVRSVALGDKYGKEVIDLMDKLSLSTTQIFASLCENLRERQSLTQLRESIGLTSEVRKKIESSQMPLDHIWEVIEPHADRVTKDQVFGGEPIDGIGGISYAQHGVIAGVYGVLNMLGISPDKRLSRRDRIRNILSDGQHVGMASYCNALLSSDKNLCEKARFIYLYRGNATKSLNYNIVDGECSILNPDCSL